MDVGTVENAQHARARRRRLADTATSAAPSELTPSREAIQARAYELYLERGGEHGSDLDDWLRAERELTSSALASPEDDRS